MNLVANKWFEHRRYFTKGPLKTLFVTLEIEPTGPDGSQSRVLCVLEAEAVNLLGELALRTVFFKSVDKAFAALVGSTAEFVRGERDTPFDAAALEIQQAVSAFNRDHASTAGGEYMVGIHEGPCIAVTENDRLDYFGNAVNMTARLEGQSLGGDIVVSTSMAEDPAVAALLAPRKGSEESAELRGFDDPVVFLRIDEAMHKVAPADQ